MNQLTSLMIGKGLTMNNYFIYDKNNFLVDYFEYKEDQLKCHYSLKGNILTKKFLQEDEEGEFYSKARIEFEDVPLKLEYMRVRGEPRIVAVKIRDSLLKLTYNPMLYPNIISEIRTEDDIAYNYTVKSEIINKILKDNK